MTCLNCGNREAWRIVSNKDGEVCNKCADLSVFQREKRTGFMFKDKLLHKNSNLDLAKQVRQEYLGTNHDEVRGRDY